MTLFQHARLLILLLGVAVAVAGALTLALAGVAGAAAQETTSTAEAAEPLSRYDSRSTAQMASEYEALEAEKEAYLRENPTASYDIDDETNALADARMRDIEDAPVEGSKMEQVEELKRQSESLYALQAWGDSNGINVNSNVYSDGAELIADDYREEAEELEAEVEEEEKAAEEEAAAEEQPETATTTGGAAGNGDGKEGQPAAKPEAAPEALPAEPAGTGFLGDINLVPILVFGFLVAGGVYALSRSAGLSVSKFFSPAMASVKRSPAKKKTSPKKTTKTAATSKIRPESETRPEPEEKRTKKPRPSAPGDDEVPLNAAEFQQWMDMPSPEPDEAGDDEEPPD